MSTIDPTRLADWFVEQMRKPPDLAAEAAHEAFEAEKAALLHVWQIRKGRKPPTARTVAEMEFAASLEACPSCGKPGVRDVSARGNGASWELTTACASCGTARTFTYAAEGDPSATTHGPDELSALPSFLITAEAFDAELQRLLPLVGSDLAARQRALICMNELVKLVEPHQRDQRRQELQTLVLRAS